MSFKMAYESVSTTPPSPLSSRLQKKDDKSIFWVWFICTVYLAWRRNLMILHVCISIYIRIIHIYYNAMRCDDSINVSFGKYSSFVCYYIECYTHTLNIRTIPGQATIALRQTNKQTEDSLCTPNSNKKKFDRLRLMAKGREYKFVCCG